jgi:hypothetical protein
VAPRSQGSSNRGANASALIILAAILSICLSACGGSTIAEGAMAPCRSLSRCVALVNPIDQGRHLLVAHPKGYVPDGGWVDHGHFERGWSLELDYEGRASRAFLQFSAEPAGDIKPWCPVHPADLIGTTSTTLGATGKLTCLALFGPSIGWAAFVSSGVRYVVHLTYRPAATPPPGVLKAGLLSLSASVR